jgi:hypothetical protein
VTKPPQWRRVTARRLFPLRLAAGFAGDEVVALADIVEAYQPSIMWWTAFLPVAAKAMLWWRRFVEEV